MRILIINDTHVGSVYGLAPEDKCQNHFQKWLYKQWSKLVNNHKNPDKLILLGDMIDGNATKDSTALWDTNCDNQVEYAVKLIKPLVGENTKVYGVGGSGYHVGKGTGFDADRQVTTLLGGKFVKTQLQIEDLLFLHKSKSLNSEFKNIVNRNTRKLIAGHETFIRYLFGAHLHRFYDEDKRDPATLKQVRIIHCPCWQYYTDFMNQSTGDAIDIGAVEIEYFSNSADAKITPILFHIPESVEKSMVGYEGISLEEVRNRKIKENKLIAEKLKMPESQVQRVRQELESRFEIKPVSGQNFKPVQRYKSKKEDFSKLMCK